MNITEVITNGPDCYPWTETFAIFPVKTISGKRVWMKKIWKRRIWAVWGTGFHMEPVVQYATLFDVLCNSSVELNDPLLGKMKAQ